MQEGSRGGVANTQPHSHPASDLWERTALAQASGEPDLPGQSRRRRVQSGSGNVQYGALLCVPRCSVTPTYILFAHIRFLGSGGSTGLSGFNKKEVAGSGLLESVQQQQCQSRSLCNSLGLSFMFVTSW